MGSLPRQGPLVLPERAHVVLEVARLHLAAEEGGVVPEVGVPLLLGAPADVEVGAAMGGADHVQGATSRSPARTAPPRRNPLRIWIISGEWSLPECLPIEVFVRVPVPVLLGPRDRTSGRARASRARSGGLSRPRLRRPTGIRGPIRLDLADDFVLRSGSMRTLGRAYPPASNSRRVPDLGRPTASGTSGHSIGT